MEKAEIIGLLVTITFTVIYMYLWYEMTKD